MFNISKEILNLVPYKPGKPISETQREFGLDKVIKLASNENPLGPSPLAQVAIQKRISEQFRYPDPAAFDLTQTISKVWQIEKSKISFGNGSNEVIDILIRIFSEPGDKICVGQYSFIAYQICAQAARVQTEFVPLKSDFKLDLKAIAAKCISDPKIKMVFIANPNNPTGTYSNKDEILEFLRLVDSRKDLLIVFDEAYNEFVRAEDYISAQQFIKTHKNVCVIRTMSKAYGLAGLRMGVLLADELVIDLFNRVRNPFNTGDLAQVASEAALRDVDFISKSQKIVWDGLDFLYQKLTELNLPFIPSQGNFLLFDVGQEAAPIFNELLKLGVIVRPVANYGLPRHIRVTVGTKEENVEFIKALTKVLGKA